MNPIFYSKTQLFIWLPVFVVAMATVFAITRFGVGVSYDSVFYLDLAKNLLDGKGMMAMTEEGIVKKTTHFPPLFPFLIASTGWIVRDMTVGIRWINILAFAGSATVSVLMIWGYTRSIIAVWCGAIFFIFSLDLLNIHFMAWSEPVFILFMLITILLLSLYVETHKRSFLWTATLFTSLSVLDRYAGFSLVITGMAGLIFWGGDRFRERITNAILFAGLSCLPLALWIAGNIGSSQSIANRDISFYSIGSKELIQGVSTISGWVSPGLTSVKMRIIIFATVVFIFFGCFVEEHFRRRCGCGSAMQCPELKKLPNILFIFSLIYMFFIVFSRLLVDPAIEFHFRMMAPMQVTVMIYLICKLKDFSTWVDIKNTLTKGFLIILLLFFSYYWVQRGIQRVVYVQSVRLGLASDEWKSSELVRYAQKLPREVTIVSNRPMALYYLTRKPCIGIPRKSLISGKENRKYEEQSERLIRKISHQSSILILFGNGKNLLEMEPDFKKSFTFNWVKRFADGAVFSINRRNISG